MTEELKPCAFCGETPYLLAINTCNEKCGYCGEDPTFYRIECRNRKCILVDIEFEFEDEERAITAWNTRHEN